MCSAIFQEIPSVPCYSRRRFGSPPTTSGGEDQRPPVGPGTRWNHRVLYKTRWVGLTEPSWEREMDLHLSRTHILRYWAGSPDQHRQTNRLYRRMRIGAAQCELSRNNGGRFWRRATPMSHTRSGSTASAIRCSPREPTFGTRATMGCGGFEKSVQVRRKMGYTWSDFWTIRG